MTSPTLTFLRAAGSVTGSRFLVETAKPPPRRRWPVPGPAGAAASQLGPAALRPRGLEASS